MQVVWFKRDLRVHDHSALSQAAAAGPVMPLYILEPELWKQPDLSARHYAFLRSSLSELNAALQRLGHRLIIRVGPATDVLEQLHQSNLIDALWSHQETWNAWTYERDKSVMAWCRARSITWHEPTQNGVIRRLANRNGWANQWDSYMRASRHIAPILPPEPTGLVCDQMPSSTSLGLQSEGESDLQDGGRSHAVALLSGFLNERGEPYTRAMSSPLTAYENCSRLSPHFAFGTLSIREALQATEQRMRDLRDLPPIQRGMWPRAMKSFSARLRWHCHFIQKLEDAPAIEVQNMHPAYDGLRPLDVNASLFDAWAKGKTGYPLIDACMRSLRATGWLNFRMRAMVMSFSSYHLWQDWHAPALHLARMFTDYEPGIHYPQVQMQSGTTGINAIRIYNPTKQSIDQDPEGQFIRKWVPELRQMETAYIHTPWKAPSQMGAYPMPIVDEASARRAAADRLYGLRKNNAAHKAIANKIVTKHASRKQKPRKAPKKVVSPKQQELPF